MVPAHEEECAGGGFLPRPRLRGGGTDRGGRFMATRSSGEGDPHSGVDQASISAMTARFGDTANPLADARGSDPSPDRQGGVALPSTTSLGQRPSSPIIVSTASTTSPQLKSAAHFCSLP